LPITLKEIQADLDRRRPGQSRITTQRKETDRARILSGVFEGRTLGTAISRIVPAAAVRYGARTIPMDDAVVNVVLDTGGRAFYRGPLPSSLYDHFMRSLAENAKMTLHIGVIRGFDRHHIVEAAFKATGLALRDALADSGDKAVFSTKGAVSSESH